jgi:RimJ/RimL family protein N-acetyltransferase
MPVAKLSRRILTSMRLIETTMSETVPSAVPGMRESTLRLTVPDGGVGDGEVVLRLPGEADVDAILPGFSDPEILEAGNLPPFGREELVETLPHLPALAESGRLLPLVVVGASGEVLGGGTLHHLDTERGIVEIGYWLLPQARGRGVATRVARLLAEHAFSLGIERVAAYVNVGNERSDRVLERAGFTREGVVRSLPRPDGRRVDKTLYSLLPGE